MMMDSEWTFQYEHLNFQLAKPKLRNRYSLKMTEKVYFFIIFLPVKLLVCIQRA